MLRQKRQRHKAEADFCQLRHQSWVSANEARAQKVSAILLVCHRCSPTVYPGLLGYIGKRSRNEMLDIGFPEKMGSHRAALALLKTTETLVSLQHINEALIPFQGICYIIFKGVYGCFPKNRMKTPRSSILIGFSIINHPFWCFFPYFWKHPYRNSSFLCKPQLLTSGFQPRKTVNLEGEHVFFQFTFARDSLEMLW